MEVDRFTQAEACEETSIQEHSLQHKLMQYPANANKCDLPIFYLSRVLDVIYPCGIIWQIMQQLETSIQQL